MLEMPLSLSLNSVKETKLYHRPVLSSKTFLSNKDDPQNFVDQL